MCNTFENRQVDTKLYWRKEMTPDDISIQRNKEARNTMKKVHVTNCTKI